MLSAMMKTVNQIKWGDGTGVNFCGQYRGSTAKDAFLTLLPTDPSVQKDQAPASLVTRLRIFADAALLKLFPEGPF
jgi:hypothetical protein